MSGQKNPGQCDRGFSLRRPTSPAGPFPSFAFNARPTGRRGYRGGQPGAALLVPMIPSGATLRALVDMGPGDGTRAALDPRSLTGGRGIPTTRAGMGGVVLHPGAAKGWGRGHPRDRSRRRPGGRWDGNRGPRRRRRGDRDTFKGAGPVRGFLDHDRPAVGQVIDSLHPDHVGRPAGGAAGGQREDH